MKIIAGKEDSGERLDRFLQGKLGDLSRAQIQKKIKAGEVAVDGKAVAPHYFLKGGETIEGKRQKARQSGGQAKGKEENEEGKRPVNPAGRQKAKGKKLTVKIVAEDKDFVVVDKPAGMVAHPDNTYKENTLVDWLNTQYPEIKNVGEDENRPGMVHRLDKEVSGLMVAARTQKMFDHLKKQFKERKVKKEYMALVNGVIKQEAGEIKLGIGRSRDGKFAAHTQERARDKGAITKYEVLRRFKNHTLIKVEILTGRTHQIRVHMKTIGHSVVGDKIYATRDIKKKGKDEGLGRLWLFARRLEFRDLAGERQKFEIQTPKGLEDFLEKIK